MVRNEADIVRVTVAHHLAQGFDSILLLDNGSTDGTDRILQELSARDGRVRWTSDHLEWRQAELVTELAREAGRQGADWVVPFDADEFWVAPGAGFERVLAETRAGALKAPLRNFIQRRDRRYATGTEALLTMTRRAEPTVGTWEEARGLVESGRIAFVEMTYPPKFVSRPSAELEIAAGNHGVSGLDADWAETTDIVCLHAPLRSIRALEAKADCGRRMDGAEWPPDLGWHARRFGKVVQAGLHEAEWRANSYEGDVLDVAGEQHRVAFDPTLRDVILPLLGPRRRKLWSFRRRGERR